MLSFCPPHRGQSLSVRSLRWLLLAVVSCAGLGLFSPVAEATTVLKLNEAQLVKKSDLIVRGTVESMKSVWVLNKSTIVTLVKIRVAEEVLKRKVGTHITVRIFGGQIGKYKVNLPGNVSFMKGNEVVLVVESSKYLPKGQYLMVGLTQGKWVIARPKSMTATLAPLAIRHLGQVKLYDPADHKGHNHKQNFSQHTMQALFKRFRAEYARLKVRKKVQAPVKVVPAVRLPSKLLKPVIDVRKIKAVPSVKTVAPVKRPAPRSK
jgi:hypothetical protein